MPIVDQGTDRFARQAPTHAIPATSFTSFTSSKSSTSSEHYALGVEEEAQILYDATIRGLADVAAGRKLPGEVVKTGCSIDLNPAYFESPHDPGEIHVDEFVGILMGLRDADAGRTVPDEVVSAQFAEYSRRLLDTR
ncbi:hypothetical protein [Pandoraea terrigena]|uniref:Uncharacterized protein n=1 Tax=Pandoraea terrigena TaxID=2508292 RepID=A0A5E4RT83_9BURK|nr:hypothetical protein [Pandoraea terrigena]VVD65279.1 hypothetical protein PTE31013_00317 [Pandoraea terrigena]